MSIFGVIITYACSWWLVLFMVLPWRVKLPETPGAGHAASAPANPMLRKKMLMTTGFAIIPTAVMYVLIGMATAAEPSIYSTTGGDDCEESVEYQPSDDADIDALGDADISADGALMQREDVHVALAIPAGDYIGDNGNNADVRNSDIYLGDVAVGRDGKARLNGQDLSARRVNTKKCK